MFATRGRRSHTRPATGSLGLALFVAPRLFAAPALAQEEHAPFPQGAASAPEASAPAPAADLPSPSPESPHEVVKAKPTGTQAAPKKSAPPPSPPAKPPTVSTETKGAPHRTLNGIYVRFGLGFSSFHDTMITDRRIDDRAADESFVGGFSTVTELAVGGSVSRRFVLGAGFYGASIADASFTYVRGQAPPEGLKRPEDFAVFGLMGDFYFHPPQGVHIQAALGMATLSGFDADNQLFRPRGLALGGGAMLGIGYEWHAGDRWGIGILGRGAGGVTTETLAGGQRWYHVIGVSPALLLSVTYH